MMIWLALFKEMKDSPLAIRCVWWKVARLVISMGKLLSGINMARSCMVGTACPKRSAAGIRLRWGIAIRRSYWVGEIVSRIRISRSIS